MSYLKKIQLKTRFLIIIGIALASVVLIISVYVISVQSRCESLLGDTHYPRPLTFWNCFDYLQGVDHPPSKSSAIELDPNPHPESPPTSTQCRPDLPPGPYDYYLDKEFCKWKLIPEPIISEAIPYIWNAYLQKKQINFLPQDIFYFNFGEGYLTEKETRVCSPLILSDGTERYISSTFTIKPFEIIDTVMSDTQPVDCYKIWKTDTLLVEPSPELGAWLENYWEKENED